MRYLEQNKCLRCNSYPKVIGHPTFSPVRFQTFPKDYQQTVKTLVQLHQQTNLIISILPTEVLWTVFNFIPITETPQYKLSCGCGVRDLTPILDIIKTIKENNELEYNVIAAPIGLSDISLNLLHINNITANPCDQIYFFYINQQFVIEYDIFVNECTNTGQFSINLTEEKLFLALLHMKTQRENIYNEMSVIYWSES